MNDLELIGAMAQRSAIVAGVVLLVVVLGLGLMAVRQRSQDEDDEPPEPWTDQTVELPRYRGRRRKPRRVPPVRHRRPVATPRLSLAERPTVEVQVIDPPEAASTDA